MVGFTKSLSREVGRLGVTVNAIAPGFIDTEMTRGLDEAQRRRIADRSALRRLAEAEDVANMAAFLIGETGRNITGAVMTIDAGGHRLSGAGPRVRALKSQRRPDRRRPLRDVGTMGRKKRDRQTVHAEGDAAGVGDLSSRHCACSRSIRNGRGDS